MLARRLRDYLGEHPFWILLVCLLVAGCAMAQRPKEVMCTYAGLETIPASSPECVAPPPPPPPPPPPATCPYNPNILAVDPACVAAEARIVSIKVFYATDRAPDPGNKEVPYGEKRNETMNYGVLTVSFPPNHQIGELEGPGFLENALHDMFHVELTADPLRHVILGVVTQLPKDTMLTLLAQSVRRADRHEVFVFVHGFNTGFDEAARRTAQLALDLQLKAVPVMYSWPSARRPLKYGSAASTADWTVTDLQRLLEDIVQRSGATKIHVLGHSMGGQVLSNAIERMQPPNLKVFHNVVLAAPDIDADVFRRRIVPAMSRAARHVTIYASRNDKALRLSKGLHEYRRLGQASDSGAISGFDTIDASAVADDWMGHSYYAQNRQVINDLVEAIMNDVRPDDKRRNLRPVRSAAGLYYKLRPSELP